MSEYHDARRLRLVARVQSQVVGAPVRWEIDLDAEHAGGRRDSWIDPDSWTLSYQGASLPFRADGDTLDGRRWTLRFRAPAAGEYEVEAQCWLRPAPRQPPAAPPDRPIPLIGAGEVLRLGTTATVGDLHVGLQTAVDVVDWFGRGQGDLLVTCHLHEGGAFLYGAVEGSAMIDGRPIFRRIGRLPGFGDDGQGYNGRVRVVDFWGDGRFALLECGRHGIRVYPNRGTRGAPSFGAPQPLLAGGKPLALGAPVQSLCPVDLGDGRVSLIVGTNDWSDYWPKDGGAWEDKPGYRPYEADGTWRGGPLRGRLYLLRNSSPSPIALEQAGEASQSHRHPEEHNVPAFAAPVELRHEDGTPLEVYGLAGPAVIPPAEPTVGFDLVVSDFLDRLWYFRNVGRPGPDGAPRFAPRTPVRCTGAAVPLIDRTPGPPPAPPVDYPPVQRLPDELVLPTCMHALAVVRWPGTEWTDLLVGAEDGYVRALRLARRTAEGVPVVEPPARLQEYGAPLSVGAKACPSVLDWDGDGRDELVLGNAAGQVLLARNAGTRAEPRFGPPQPLIAGERTLWLMAGSPGTIQGPSEVKWGYINPAVGQWPLPGGQVAAAIVCGDALGNNTLYLVPSDSAEGRKAGQGHHTPCSGSLPVLAAERCTPAMAPASVVGARSDSPSVLAAAGYAVSRGRRLHVLRDGRWQPLVTRWRCRPQLVDWGDGEVVYVQVDEAGKLARYRILPDGPDAEDGTPRVVLLSYLPYKDGTAIQLDADTGGRVGRIKLAIADWDGDGRLDLLVGTSGSHPPGLNTLRKATVWLLRNVGTTGQPVFARPELLPLEHGQPARFGGHSCVPAPCSFDGPGSPIAGVRPRPDLLVGSENGRLYAYRRSYIDAAARLVAPALDRR